MIYIYRYCSPLRLKTMSLLVQYWCYLRTYVDTYVGVQSTKVGLSALNKYKTNALRCRILNRFTLCSCLLNSCTFMCTFGMITICFMVDVGRNSLNWSIMYESIAYWECFVKGLLNNVSLTRFLKLIVNGNSCICHCWFPVVLSSFLCSFT